MSRDNSTIDVTEPCILLGSATGVTDTTDATEPCIPLGSGTSVEDIRFREAEGTRFYVPDRPIASRVTIRKETPLSPKTMRFIEEFQRTASSIVDKEAQERRRARRKQRARSPYAGPLGGPRIWLTLEDVPLHYAIGASWRKPPTPPSIALPKVSSDLFHLRSRQLRFGRPRTPMCVPIPPDRAVVTVPFTFEIAGGEREPMLRGSFNGWTEPLCMIKCNPPFGHPLDANSTDTFWTCSVVLGPGLYEYKYTVKGKEDDHLLDPYCCTTTTPEGYTNNVVLVTSAGTYTVLLPNEEANEEANEDENENEDEEVEVE